MKTDRPFPVILLALLLGATAAELRAADQPNAWQIADTSSSGSLSYTNALTPAQRIAATNQGWRFSVVSRLLSGGAAPAQNMIYGNGTRRFAVVWNTNANGALIATLSGTNFVPVLTPNGQATNDYHTHELVYDPVSTNATYLVDGNAVLTWPGEAQSAQAGTAMWGANASAGLGRVNYHRVQFAINGLGTISEYNAGFQPTTAVAPNPVTQGWLLFTNTAPTTTLTNFSVAPDVVALPALKAWQITDNVTTANTSIGYTTNFSPGLVQTATNRGWRYSMTSRLVDDFGATVAMFMVFGDGTRRHGLGWDFNAAKDTLVVNLPGSGTTNVVVANAADATAYHTHELIRTNGVVNYFFDGQFIATSLGDTAAAQSNQVFWGSAAGGGQGQVNFHRAEFWVNGQGRVAAYNAGDDLSPDTAPSPTTQGWTRNQSGTGVTEGPIGFSFTPPNITCPANLVTNAPAGAGNLAVFWATPSATGSPAPMVACAPPSGSSFNLGTTTVTCTATNLAGTNVCTFTVAACSDATLNITVTNTNDSGAGSLRQAILDLCPGGTIDFAPALNGRRIVLTSGDLMLSKDLSILGPGATNLSISGNASSRVFYITNGVTCTLAGLTITNGLSDVELPTATGLAGSGGGILNRGSLTVSNAAFRNNRADKGGGGGAIHNYSGATLTVHNCTLNGNSATYAGYGGGLHNASGATATVISSVLNNNAVDFGANGGGIFNAGTLTLQSSTLSGNRVVSNGDGAGILNRGTLTVQDSTVSGNQIPGAGNGGGILNSGTLNVVNSTVSGNAVAGIGNGGGIDNPAGTLRVQNSTLSGNSTASSGGGIYNAGTATIQNSTLTANRGGIFDAGIGGLHAGGTERLTNSIVAGNLGQGGNTPSDISGGTVDAAAFNLIGSTNGVVGITNGVNGNLVGNAGGGTLAIASILNTSLALNGGPTRTHALAPGSPALNAGTNVASQPAYDQRGPGFARLVGGTVDLGAYEVQSTFTNVPIAGLPGVTWSSTAWGDYDNDGRLDFLLTGPGTSQLWRNTPAGFSNVTSQIAAGLPRVADGSVAWGDYDNDGRLDFLLTGTTNIGAIAAVSQLWRNTPTGFSNVTSQVATGLPGVLFSSTAWGDYDNDGRRDFLLTGEGPSGRVSQLWRNTPAGFSNVTSQIAVGLPGVRGGAVAWADYDNDGRLDFLLTGEEPGGLVSQLWRNTPAGFSNVTSQVAVGLPAVYYSAAAWGDYDNDGRLDYFLTGVTNVGTSGRVTQLWRNTPAGFSNVTSEVAAGLPQIGDGSIAWGDYDTDGRLDVLLAGLTTNAITSQLWRNTPAGFSNVTSQVADGLPSVYNGSMAWADYDNDGRLDFLITGAAATNTISQLWRNTLAPANTPPSAPTGLASAFRSASSVTLSWNAALDTQTPTRGLSYNVVLSTNAGAVNLASPQADVATGFRRVVHLGPIHAGTNATLSYTFTNLPYAASYFWSVQALDTAFAGGPFAPVQSFVLATPPILTCQPTVKECTGGLTPVNYNVSVIGTFPGPVTLTCVPPNGTLFPVGTSNVVCTATSGGASASCSFTVTVVDPEPPLVTCPADLVLTADSEQAGKGNVTFTATAFDDCGSNPLLLEDFGSGDGGFTAVTTMPFKGTGFTYYPGTDSWQVNQDGAENNAPNTSRLSAPTLTMNRAGVLEVAFRHRWSLEWDWDGCALEVSVNGGAFAKVAGSAFVAGGYNGTVKVNSLSILGGQSAWIDDSPSHQGPTYINSVANLGYMNAGDTVVLRFVYGGDHSFRGSYLPSWEINSVFVRLLSTPVVCTPPSGSTFPVGLTTVNCTSTDPSGNIGRCSFTVTVTPCTPSRTVLNTNDSGPGSLRDAIANSCVGGTITFDPALNGQTIVLTSGELVINKSLSILGPGADLLAISGNGNSRVFFVSSNTPPIQATIAGLSIERGNGVGRIAPRIGGGIFNSSGALTLSNCTLRGHTNSGNSGGAVFNSRGVLTILNCALHGNLSASGGGIYNSDGELTIWNSTLSGNAATTSGGAVMNNGGTVVLATSTLSDNSAGTLGGGIYNNQPTRISVENSIVAGNTAASSAPDIRSLADVLASDGYNFIGSTNGIANAATLTDLTFASTSTTLDQLLQTSNGQPVLTNNGGATPTIALVPGSPALNAGTNVASLPPHDQRGPGFPRVVDGRVDLGAYELDRCNQGGPPYFGDVNADGLTFLDDFATLRANFGATGVGRAGGDLDGDSTVDAADFTVLRNNFGHASALCYPIFTPPTGIPYAGYNGLSLRLLLDGTVEIVNLSVNPVAISGYSLSATNGVLNPGDWRSLNALAGTNVNYLTNALGAGAASFTTANPTSQLLSELNLNGVATFPPGFALELGRAYAGSINVTNEVRFFYVQDGVVREGAVNRAAVAIPDDSRSLRAGDSCVADVRADTLNFQSFDFDGDPLTYGVTPPGPYPIGSTDAFFWAIDNKGASNGTPILISVVDDAPPRFTNCPNVEIVVALPPGSNTVQVFYEVGAEDSCSPDVTVSCNFPSGSFFPIGETEVRCTASARGGTDDCRFVVRVSAPEFSVGTLGLPPVSFGAAAWGDYDNDGRLDLVLTGGSTNGLITQIWRNEGDNTFSNINAGLPGLNVSAAAWGDLDNDGHLDLAIAGSTANNQRITQLWRNTGSGFVNLDAGVTGVDDGALAWGDYDHDGKLDLLLTGVSGGPRVTQIWRNQGNNTFSNINANLPGTSTGGAAWGDYDNDGRLDIVLTGFDSGGGRQSVLWRNLGGGVFERAAVDLPGITASAVAWADYDNDGWLDLAIAGNTGPRSIAQVWRNTGGSFSNINASLPGLAECSVAWGDYDNDGKPDLLLTGTGGTPTGPRTQIWRNVGTNFVNTPSGLSGVRLGRGAWGDYNNDGLLDAVLVGSSVNGVRVAQVWRNNLQGSANTVPTAPSGLAATANATGVALRWSAAGDAQTPSSGLSYNVALGTNAGGIHVLAPQSDPASGRRRVPALGNVQLGTNATLDLPPGTYFWAVQAIDSAWAGGAFADGGSFVVGTGVEVRIVAFEQRSPTRFWIQFTGAIGTAYRVEGSADLATWTSLGAAAPDAGVPGLFEYLDTDAAPGQRFYRVATP